MVRIAGFSGTGCVRLLLRRVALEQNGVQATEDTLCQIWQMSCVHGQRAFLSKNRTFGQCPGHVQDKSGTSAAKVMVSLASPYLYLQIGPQAYDKRTDVELTSQSLRTVGRQISSSSRKFSTQICETRSPSKDNHSLA